MVWNTRARHTPALRAGKRARPVAYADIMERALTGAPSDPATSARRGKRGFPSQGESPIRAHPPTLAEFLQGPELDDIPACAINPEP